MKPRRTDATSAHALPALLPRWRSLASSSSPSYARVDVDAVQDSESVANSSSPHSSSLSRMPTSRARSTVVLLVCAALSLFIVLALCYGVAAPPTRANASSPSNSDAHSSNANAALVLTPEQLLQEFSVAPLVLHQRDTIRVRFGFNTPASSLVSPPPPSERAGDWIGVYCVDDESKDVDVHDFIDARRTEGAVSGTLTFGPMVNMRCSWQFKLVTSDGTVLATSPFVRFAEGPTEPLQIHLAMTTEPTQMRVHWTSAEVTQAVVMYGRRADSLRDTSQASQTSYLASDMCKSPARTVSAKNYRDPGQLYDALMTGLEPGKTYFYRVGDASANGKLSAIRSFTVPPQAGVSPVSQQQKTATSMSFFTFGDLNSPVGATENFAVEGSCGTTLKLIEQDLATQDAFHHNYVAVMHVGDISYAKGSTFIWDQFGELIQGVASRIPYMVSIGNHDYGYLEGNELDPVKFPRNRVFESDGTHGYQSYGECGVPTEKRFHMPDNGNSVFWYSVEMGLVHHTVLSGEHDFSSGSPMYEWLLNDFKAVDRGKTPWLFVHMHRPMYCSVGYAGDYDRSLLYRDHLEQVFSDFHVDVVFSGHYHSYERTCPVFDEICYSEEDTGKALAPVHLMVGSGGANVDNYGYYDVDWRAQAFQTYGYGRVHVYNATHTHFEFVSNKEEAVTDSTWIVSDHNWSSDRPRRYRPGLFARIVMGVTALAFVVGGVTMLWRRRHRASKRKATPYIVRKTRDSLPTRA